MVIKKSRDQGDHFKLIQGLPSIRCLTSSTASLTLPDNAMNIRPRVPQVLALAAVPQSRSSVRRAAVVRPDVTVSTATSNNIGAYVTVTQPMDTKKLGICRNCSLPIGLSVLGLQQLGTPGLADLINILTTLNKVQQVCSLLKNSFFSEAGRTVYQLVQVYRVYETVECDECGDQIGQSGYYSNSNEA
ncbi:hypothetical protein CTI12_AA167440 [Artemisia annua]|uniref:Uncharacterized protein n=1 Tax=Artemisia annua TaxID=35608 RepID=A0A2U1P8L4_ARTAN|nr:hypothetical protein CTI12_AA167440 [Artemisia annua]